ncbi:MAG: hypothetical protein AAGF30_07565 [Pseudomonadota bacterium]
MTDPDLWARLLDYPLPSDSGGRSFVEQLRADQRISEKTARRGIEEYRRFLYLSATGVGRTVPSRAVDTVWHLHLAHTRDYWEKFVPEVLGGNPIHHAPGTPDGHANDFAATLKRYEMEFGEAPPRGIWKRGSPLKDWAATLFTGVFGAFWVGGVSAIGAPFLFTLSGAVLAASLFLLTLGPHLSRAGLEVNFGVDIWSDSEGGDCGADGGGGCGD